MPCQNRWARVQVRADLRPHGVTQPHQRFGVVDHEARVHLQRDLVDAVIAGERRRLAPVGNHLAVPLPLQDRRIVGRPGVSDPVGIHRALVIAGTSREADDGLDSQLLGQPNRVALLGDVPFGKLRVGVDRIAVHGQRAQVEPARLDCFLKLRALLVARQQLLRVAVLVAGIGPAADLQVLHADRGQVVQGLRQRQVAQQHRHHADSHGAYSISMGDPPSAADLVMASRTTSQRHPSSNVAPWGATSVSFTTASSRWWISCTKVCSQPMI